MDFLALIKTGLEIISNLFSWKTKKIENVTTLEVVDDKNKMELAIYHAKKVIQIYEKIDIKKSVKLKYHLNKFYKYC